MKTKSVVEKKMDKKKLNLQSEIDKIVDAYDIFTQSSHKNSGDALKVGAALTITKNKVKKEKGLWIKYRTTKLSHIPAHDIRDFMYLSDHYNKFPLPGLLWVNRTNLKKLYQFCKGKSPKVILAEHGIDLISKDATADEIRPFQDEVLELLRPVKDPAKQNNKGKAEKQTSDPVESGEPTLRTYCRGLLQLMEQDLGKKRSELKYFGPVALKHFTDFQATLALYIERRTPQSDDE